MITAIVLYDLPPSIGLEECREHFTRIAPDFLKAPGFVRKQFICRKEGGVAGDAAIQAPYGARTRRRYRSDLGNACG